MRDNMNLCCLTVFALAIGLAYAQWDPNCADNRLAMVHLFEWKWNDIARECEDFLAPAGYCGVQVSPPTDHAMIEGGDEPMRPWWERYQPVSYKLHSRSGTEEEFINMVKRCNNVGIRIYVDAVINHMCGMERAGVGIGGSRYDSDAQSFPDVPYTMENFNQCEDCPSCCCINAWHDHTMVRNCRLLGLIDLDPKVSSTESHIVDYLNHVIDIGVAGFRVDAAKHMWPEDLESIYSKLHNLNTTWFRSGARPFFAMEVIDMNQHGEVNVHMYKHIGPVTEFRFCSKVAEASQYLWDLEGIYDPGWGMVEPGQAFVFVDNHDNQRGHGGGGNIVTHESPRQYKIAQAITLGYTYGHPRVMSSYYFDDSEAGPPHNPDYSTADVIINPDGSCGGGWVCEHRWPAIAGMAGFSKAANGQPYIRRHNGGNEIAWSRGNRAFVAITNHNNMDMTLYTGLPSGTYCDVIHGCPSESGCTGPSVYVDGGGSARITINDRENPILAIHVEAMSGSGTCVGGGEPTTTPPGPTTPPPTSPPGWTRTVVFMYAATAVGEDVFFRGGLDHERKDGCTNTASTSDCAIPIRHISLGTSDHYDKHNAWRAGDNYLDWYGAEPGQGRWNNIPAEGTPAAWTSSHASNPGYQEDNEWGDHYWKVEFDMDCSKTENGWFELKAFIRGGQGWEQDINQGACLGNAGGQAPFASSNHVGRCGYTNRFQFDFNLCFIDNL